MSARPLVTADKKPEDLADTQLRHSFEQSQLARRFLRMGPT